MSNFPCKNPNCKSYGTPHPNCKCYGGMAEGGDVSHFCCVGRAHGPSCEFYAEGGFAGNLEGPDHHHHVSGHLGRHGILGVLKMGSDHDLSKYERSVKRGHRDVHDHFDRVFKREKHPAKEDRSKHRSTVDKWVKSGGIDNDIQQEVYKQNAPGHPPTLGVLNSHPIEHAYPEQNILLNTAKGRVSNYLKSLLPQEHVPKLPFDSAPDPVEKNRSYEEALEIADHPLSVVRKISSGTLDQDDIKHLSAMYPELYESMQKKITEKIITAQLEGKKPDAKTRQALSLFMGAPLSTEYTPQGIMAAQAVFAKPGAPQPQGSQGSKPKRSTSALTKSDAAFLTGSQSLARRGQKV